MGSETLAELGKVDESLEQASAQELRQNVEASELGQLYPVVCGKIHPSKIPTIESTRSAKDSHQNFPSITALHKEACEIARQAAKENAVRKNEGTEETGGGTDA